MDTIRNSVVVGVGKGGVAKTTTSLSLSACWASEGQRVLHVDLDAQADSTKGFGQDPDEVGAGRSLSDTLTYGDELLVIPVRQGIDLVPAGHHTKRLSQSLGNEPNASERFVEVFGDAAQRYDRIVFDLPPSNVSALADLAFDHGEFLIAPCTAEAFDIGGLESLAKNLSMLDSNIVLLGVVMTRFDTRDGSKNADAELAVDEIIDGVTTRFATAIHRSRAYSTCTTQRVLITEFAEWAEEVKKTTTLSQRIADRIQLPDNIEDTVQRAYEFAEEVESRMAEVRKAMKVAS